MADTPLGRFLCNVCGTANHSLTSVDDREEATCRNCGSCMRFRAVILMLSRALFGSDLSLPDFPLLKSVRGLGISDSEVYSGRLANRFSYINTFLHREPYFDLSDPDQTEFGRYDFVICTEVLEHVAPPVEHAFQTLARLLKPNGVLVLTAPYSLEAESKEHFPDWRQTVLAEVGGRMVLVNRTPDGLYQVFDQLVFHGGPGSTLEMREFSEAALRQQLGATGLNQVRIDASGSRKFGVVFTNGCSLPIVAAAHDFTLAVSGVREIVAQLTAAQSLLKEVRKSRWVRAGRHLRIGPRLPPSP